jgi:putative intracellular protease/amidase
MALKDRTVAILVGAGTPAEELNPVQQALSQAGAEVVLVGATIEDLERHVLSQDLTVGVGLGIDAAKQIWFDAVVIPGGTTVEDYCGLESVYDFLGSFDMAHKPIAAIGRGILLLAHVDLLDGRRVAAPADVAEAVERMGGEVAPCPFTIDRPLLTACGADGVPALTEALVTALSHLHLTAKGMASPIID